MFRILGKRMVASSLLFVLALFGFGGCGKNSPIAGGTVDKTDYSAPKVITSKEITAFYTTFCLYGEWSDGRSSYQYTFEVKENENGVLTAYEPDLKLSVPADETLLNALQTVIDEEQLVQKNGIYRVTAGLPPEYQECNLTVDYASGERLTFTTNNEPTAQWANRIYLTFADWFAAQGDDTLLPPRENGTVTRLLLTLREDSVLRKYGDIAVPEEMAIDGETLVLQRYLYDTENNQPIAEAFIPFPADYYEQVTALISEYDLRPFNSSSALYGMGRETTDDDSNPLSAIELELTYDSGSMLRIKTSNAADKELLQPLLDALCEYHEELFRQG